ncbi:M56 family metallopeptidase [Pseudonocardia sp. N23]|uniref:M56 family metallopeptidase n=1 Tax=Pseudonocardia sp. N23 TaxID=1987376 RepID=UPI000BFD5038|nr:M56 family metallopeptidase [Pseudonocardia sp. N23]GAY10926.1 peptidase M48, Ste24p precursor [Pseudonocardia sp. N23]
MTAIGLVVLLFLLLGLPIAAIGAAPRCARSLSPIVATAVLTTFAVSIAAGTWTVLVLVAYVGTAGLVPAFHPADWSAPAIATGLPLPVAIGAAALATVLAGRGALGLARTLRSDRAAITTVDGLPVAGDLVVLPAPEIVAYAVPARTGRRGRIVVSAGMLRTLTAPQRRALLAHERAHLVHHHHRYLRAAYLAAMLNPLLGPVERAVDQAVERWADDAAVREVGDRATVAEAIGVAAVVESVARGGATLAAGHSDVVDRVRDLLDRPPRRPGAGVLLLLVTVLAWIVVALLVVHTHGLVEAAELSGS